MPYQYEEDHRQPEAVLSVFRIEGVVVDDCVRIAGLLAVTCALCANGHEICTVEAASTRAPDTLDDIRTHWESKHGDDREGQPPPRILKTSLSPAMIEAMLSREPIDPAEYEIPIIVGCMGTIYSRDKVAEDDGFREILILECLLCDGDQTSSNGVEADNQGFWATLIAHVEHSQVAHPGIIDKCTPTE